MKPKPKITLTERAVIQRVNRKLSKRDQKLCKTRGDSYRWAYYVLDTYRDEIRGQRPIINSKADVEEFARQIGALREFERVA